MAYASKRLVGHFLLVTVLSFPAAKAWGDEPCQLTSGRCASDLMRVQVTMQVGGELKLPDNQRSQKLPMSVISNLTYDELTTGLPQGSRGSWRAVRHYDEALAVIKIDKGGEKQLLGDFHRLIGVETNSGATTLFCPTGALTREELDLLDIPANSLILDELLPREPVKIGDTWKPAADTLKPLLGLDVIGAAKVQSVLIAVNDSLAQMTMAGTVSGAVGGVTTGMEIKAKYAFDRKLDRIVWFALLIKEKRAVGSVGPGLDVVAKLILKITPLQESKYLSPELVAKLPTGSDPKLTKLAYESGTKPYRLGYDRRWFVTGDDPKLLVLRMVDRGELVAQCNISALTDKGHDKPLTLAEFQQDIQRSLGDDFGQFVHAASKTNSAGYRIYRVVATGEVAQLPIQWIYYYVTAPDRRPVTLAFTLESALETRFGRSDQELINGLQLLAEPARTAGKPSPAKPRDTATEPR